MSNTYTEFSEMFKLSDNPDEKKKQVDWINHQLEKLEGYRSHNVVTGADEIVFFKFGTVPEEIDAANIAYIGPRFLVDDTDLDEECSVTLEFVTLEFVTLEFEYFFKDGGIIFYATEYGDPEQVAKLVEKFLKEFDTGRVWSMEFCYYCNKPRPGQFGGGAVVVTAEGSCWNSTDMFCARIRERLENASDKSAEVEQVNNERLTWLNK